MKTAVFVGPLCLAALTLPARDGAASQPPPTVWVRAVEPTSHTGLPPDVTFRLRIDDYHELLSDVTEVARMSPGAVRKLADRRPLAWCR